MQGRSNRLAQLLDKISAQGFSQRQVAMELNVPPQYLSDLRHARRHMTEAFARRFAEAYNVSINWLLTGQGSEESLQVVQAGAGGTGGTYCLPVLNAPCIGDPRHSRAWDGSTIVVAGAAAAAVERARLPYVLRMGGHDTTGRFQQHDLVLCSQDIRSDSSFALVRLSGEEICVARQDDQGQFKIPGKRESLLRSMEILGHCVGIIWAPL